MTKSLLYTIRQGPPDGAPFFVLHDRYESLEHAEALGARLGEDRLRIAVRAPRVQTMGGSGMTRGHFWYIGPRERPELSTLGDGLYQLELLIDETWQAYGQRPLGLLGRGEGGTIALLAACLFPDRFSHVVALDAVLPVNLADMPIEPRRLDGVNVLLAGPDDHHSATRLANKGATVTSLEAADNAAFASFLRSAG